MQKSTTSNFQETQKLGENFAAEILARDPQKNATVLALSGDLGAGKTTFLQGFAKGLGIKEIVNSPTFIIMKKFQITSSKSQINSKFKIQNSKFTYFYHFDLYRLETRKDLDFLNFQEIIFNPKNIVAIEWPGKLGDVLPENSISINFSHLKENTRGVNVIE